MGTTWPPLGKVCREHRKTELAKCTETTANSWSVQWEMTWATCEWSPDRFQQPCPCPIQGGSPEASLTHEELLPPLCLFSHISSVGLFSAFSSYGFWIEGQKASNPPNAYLLRFRAVCVAQEPGRLEFLSGRVSYRLERVLSICVELEGHPALSLHDVARFRILNTWNSLNL